MGKQSVDVTILFSDDKRAPVQIGREDGAQILYVETLYEATDDWSHGPEPVGEVFIEETDPQLETKRRLTVTFRFTGGRKGSLLGHGIVDKDQDDKLAGKIGGGSGTGKQRDWQGEIDLMEFNPKRWIFEPALKSSS
jgi:hypothetical protein